MKGEDILKSKTLEQCRDAAVSSVQGEANKWVKELLNPEERDPEHITEWLLRRIETLERGCGALSKMACYTIEVIECTNECVQEVVNEWSDLNDVESLQQSLISTLCAFWELQGLVEQMLEATDQ